MCGTFCPTFQCTLFGMSGNSLYDPDQSALDTRWIQPWSEAFRVSDLESGRDCFQFVILAALSSALGRGAITSCNYWPMQIVSLAAGVNRNAVSLALQ